MIVVHPYTGNKNILDNFWKFKSYNIPSNKYDRSRIKRPRGFIGA